MSKCQVTELVRVWSNLVKDAIHAHPTLEAELSKDLIRLNRIVEQRGLPTLLIDLPAIGRHFDKCLSVGQYTPCGLPLTKRRHHGVNAPIFLGGLYLLVFDDSGCLRDDPDIDAIFFIRQLCYVFKKADFEPEQEKTDELVRQFFLTDAALPEPERFWNAQTPVELAEGPCYGGFRSSEILKTRLEEVCPPEGRQAVSDALTILDTVSNIFAPNWGLITPQNGGSNMAQARSQKSQARPTSILGDLGPRPWRTTILWLIMLFIAFQLGPVMQRGIS